MKKISIVLLMAVILYGDETVLSKQKQELLELKREKIENDRAVGTKSWISPFILSLSTDKSKNSLGVQNDSKNANISWNQDLFRSGGIYYTIRQSNADADANLLGVDLEAATYLKQVYTLKAQIQREKLSVKKSELTLKNMDIDLFIVKEKFKAGLSDISELNQATLNKDTARTNLIGVKNILASEIYELQKLTQQEDVDGIEIPQIDTVSKEEYLKRNLELLRYTKQESAQEASWKNARSAYLPKLSFNSSYGYTQNDYTNSLLSDSNINAYNLGLTLSIPFDINTFGSIDSVKLQYLQTKSSQIDRRLELEHEYDKHINNIHDFKEKISVADSMIKMYDELYGFTKGLVLSGLKSSYDLESLENSVKIQKLEKEIQNYNIIIEKITLYFDTKHSREDNARDAKSNKL